LQAMFDPLSGPGLQNYWRAHFHTDLGPDSIGAHVEHGSKVPTIFSGLHLYAVDGAAARVGAHETAWSYRDARWSEVIFSADPDPATNDDRKQWVVRAWEATYPYSAGGGYVNFLGNEGTDRVRTSYRDNYDRLAEIKRRYDPTNVFRLNQNIEPVD
jgi:FAD/FMN-containing dehydrogenase